MQNLPVNLSESDKEEHCCTTY